MIFSVLFSRIPDTLTAAFADPKLAAALKRATDPATAHGQAILSNPHNAHILSLLKDPSKLGSALDGDTAFLKTSNADLAAPFLHGFANATVTVFWVSLAVIAVAFILSFFLKATPLRTKSAQEEVADDDEMILATRAAEQMGATLNPSTSTNPIIVVGSPGNDGPKGS